jgi:chromosome segregation ATPase
MAKLPEKKIATIEKRVASTDKVEAQEARIEKMLEKKKDSIDLVEVSVSIQSLQKRVDELTDERITLQERVKYLEDTLEQKCSECSELNEQVNDLQSMMLNSNEQYTSKLHSMTQYVGKYKLGEMVTYPNKYASMPFRVAGTSGRNKQEVTYKIYSELHNYEEDYVPETELKKHEPIGY